jgi:hypothetical protein
MIKVVSIRSALDRKGNEKERSLQNCLLSLWLCVILAAALTLKQARKDFDHFFSSSFFDQNKKQSIPRRIWIFSLTNRASIFFAVFSFYFYAFTVQNFHESHALFIWLFSSLFTRYWKMSNLYGAWHASPSTFSLLFILL